MFKSLALAATAALALSAAPAAAAVVTLGNITGTWFDGVLTDGTSAPTYTGNGSANASASWGDPAESARSSYDFASVGSVGVVVNPPAGSAGFTLATFRHNNFPIFPPSLSTMSLRVTADVDIDGASQGSRDFIFAFRHDETTNNSNPCAFGGANGQGQNVNGCADRVRLSFSGISDTFQIGQEVYTLDIDGFSVGGDTVSEFLTAERVSNEAELIGRVTLFTLAVPEPGTWAMMIAGFGLVGVAMRRRANMIAA